MSEEKRNTDRKRNLIILIEKYLLTLGCIDSVTKIEAETQISLEKWDTADNIDLFMIFLDYEQYYEARFGKIPKVVKKVEDKSTISPIEAPTNS
jgi:katanin p60 ATPase-containing subunit A1